MNFCLKDNLNAIQFCMSRALPGANVAFVEITVTLQTQTMEVHAFALLILSLTDISYC